jgi:hypothetical protein
MKIYASLLAILLATGCAPRELEPPVRVIEKTERKDWTFLEEIVSEGWQEIHQDGRLEELSGFFLSQGVYLGYSDSNIVFADIIESYGDGGYLVENVRDSGSFLGIAHDNGYIVDHDEAQEHAALLMTLAAKADWDIEGYEDSETLKELYFHFHVMVAKAVEEMEFDEVVEKVEEATRAHEQFHYFYESSDEALAELYMMEHGGDLAFVCAARAVVGAAEKGVRSDYHLAMNALGEVAGGIMVQGGVYQYFLVDSAENEDFVKAKEMIERRGWR